MDCVSDLNTKALAQNDRERLVPQLMGHEEWVSFKSQHLERKPGVCKHCMASDVTHSRNEEGAIEVNALVRGRSLM